MKLQLHHQNIMLAIRAELGWPLFTPANDCIAFSTGRVLDGEQADELARVARLVGKDIIYSSWADDRAKTMSGLTVVYRDLQTIDIVDRVVAYAADATAPIMLVSTRGDERFAIDRRGSLTRIPGKPSDLGAGRRRAMQRIQATAKTFGDAMLANNRWVPAGAAAIASEAETATVVRFG